MQRGIQGARIWNRDSCCWARLYGANVWMGNNDTYNGTGNQKCYTVPAVLPAVDVTFACVGTGRYFFVQQNNTAPLNSWPTLTLAEVQVWGSLIPEQGICTACDTCAKCGSGQYSTATAAQSVATCQSCAAGSYGTDSGLSTASSCVACGAGSYSTALGATA